MADKYIRFITNQFEPVTGENIGFFKAAYALRREGVTSGEDASRLDALLNWFDDNLDAPERFAKSKNRHVHGKAISWFKHSALEHIDKSRALLELLHRYGTQSEMILTAKPGVVIYEDEYQIAAIPFKDRDF